jgi:hypothetical protein
MFRNLDLRITKYTPSMLTVLFDDVIIKRWERMTLANKLNLTSHCSTVLSRGCGASVKPFHGGGGNCLWLEWGLVLHESVRNKWELHEGTRRMCKCTIVDGILWSYGALA